MKGIEKLSDARLGKVLGQEGKISSEVLNAALRECSERGAALAEILVRDGIMTEWDLARVISHEFSLPILLPSSYSIDKDVFALIPREIIRATRVIPVDRFGNILAVAMPLLVSAKVLGDIEMKVKMEIFPYVSPISEINRIVDDRIKEPAAPTPAGGWEKLFDEADLTLKKSDDEPGTEEKLPLG